MTSLPILNISDFCDDVIKIIASLSLPLPTASLIAASSPTNTSTATTVIVPPTRPVVVKPKVVTP